MKVERFLSSLAIALVIGGIGFAVEVAVDADRPWLWPLGCLIGSFTYGVIKSVTDR